ncbi:predicted protein [Naegleria gruberi]|uniref:Predicted protein n=1 Tax=Naegleria gruberi TaxID=5762 RepID=D2VTR4_NAEGR|nr:uncharacterized protein NAEGRDRAFT_52182 [Naegleria gruberi]EFC39699.1 predicted protein [Naegleria gruberi]|eukprot:XP_002672443.1 predicted protein [Naegleria gruberi strain NEG-M]
MVAYFASLASLDNNFEDLRPRRPTKVSPRSSTSSSPRNNAGEHSPTSQDSSDILQLSPTTSMTKLPVERTRSHSNSGNSTYSSSSVSSSGSQSVRRNSPLESPQPLERSIREMARNYVINIEKFLSTNNHDENESFSEFLKSECNLAPLEFYQKVTEFTTKPEKKELARYLIKNYIKERSNSEINIANNVREVILKEYKECKHNNSQVSSNIFEKACNEVKLSLKNDSFTRFVASEQFSKLILKKFNQANKSLDSNNSTEILESIFESIGSLSPLSSPKFSAHSHPQNIVNKSLDTIANSQIIVTPPNE